MSAPHLHDPTEVYRDMERIFGYFDRSADGRNDRVTIFNLRRRAKPFDGARRITRAARIIMGATLVASLGYGVAVYMAGHHLLSAEHAGHDMMATATTVGAKPVLMDFARLSVTPGAQADHIKYQLAPFRRRPKIDHAASKDASKTARQGQDREAAAEKLRREYAEDAAITRQLNSDALNTVVHKVASARR